MLWHRPRGNTDAVTTAYVRISSRTGGAPMPPSRLIRIWEWSSGGTAPDKQRTTDVQVVRACW